MNKVSVIILNYNSSGLLFYCLRSIQRTLPSTPLEVIVVDNASIDGSRVQLAQWQTQQPFAPLNIQVILRDHNNGYAAGNNHALRAATGDAVLILNPDISVQAGAIDALVQYLTKHPHVGIVGPKLLNPDRSLQYSCYRFPTLAMPVYRRTPLGNTANGRRQVRQYMMMDWDHASSRRVDWIMGSAMFVRRSVLETIGGLDEQFFMYFEDTDWCRRAGNAGFEVHYHPAATMIHYHQRQSAELGLGMLFSRLAREHVLSGIRYFAKHRPGLLQQPHE
ncbi:glycosyltransferase family 2 protein [Candidatus Uhrbacteria bacterium]|nr:glycosyltransferase family 2 protein [Candidatus Uhrbacteria bacterium]